MRITRCLILASLLAACAGSPDATECKTGITCPEGTKCAAAQAVCLNNDCGDGITQSNEVCDDGNILDGDGCAANCGSREVCGDSTLNAAAGELCDDGNTIGGDGCADDCRSVEVCGNAVRDVNEACDDGNTVPGDGCSGNCKSTEICGNSVVDINEKCDDGAAPGGCNADCQGGTGCGDGAIDRDGSGNALEECDDGNVDNQDDCTNLCNLNTCGDGIVQMTGARTEACDPSASFGETATCNLDCTTCAAGSTACPTVAMCGDGKINNAAGEECDDGLMNANDRDCTATCHVNVCGDSLPNTTGPNNTEDCDDGFSTTKDACSNQCTMTTCGNGVVEGIEACDDFNLNNNDGCSSACRFEKCGDGLINNGEACDGTGTASVMGTPGETATCNLDCTTCASPSIACPTLAMCGDGKVNKTAGEECDDQNINDDNDTCRNNCKLNICGDGKKSPSEGCDDGNQINTDACNNDCALQTCGDAILQGSEICDDGIPATTPANGNRDGCLNTCVLPTCGDGFIRTGVEDCDNGLTTGNGPDKNCTATCQDNECGDGFRDLEGSSTEACDDGNQNTETVCPYGVPTCMQCSATCNMVLNLAGPFCGDGTTSNGEVCDDRSPTQTCGRCGNGCLETNATTAVAATGIIFASDNGGGNISEGDTLTLSDGLVTVVFEFDENNTASTTAGRLNIDVNANLSASAVRTAIADAIDAARASNGLRLDTTDLSTSGLIIRNLRESSIGNQPIGRSGLGSNFFTEAAMTGGSAGDCPAATGCSSDLDCLATSSGTGQCNSGVCAGS